jgi:hypothetical protein
MSSQNQQEGVQWNSIKGSNQFLLPGVEVLVVQIEHDELACTTQQQRHHTNRMMGGSD